MVKYLIIPDVHGRTFWRDIVKEYLENHQETTIIFLGDYLDPYQYEGIYPEDAFVVFEEIIELKKQYKDRIILLVGNHDLHYIQNHHRGCRMDYERKSDIHALFRDNADLFEVCVCDKVNDNNVIFSHAGFTKNWLNWHIGELSPEWYDKYTDEEIYENIDFEFIKSIDWKTKLFVDKEYYFGDCSYYRGGDAQFASCLWADQQEMIMSDDYIDAIQIFGHSQQEEDPINYKNILYCLDCRKPFIMNENAEVKNADGSEIEENGTQLKEHYEKKAKDMLKYAGFFI